MEKSPESKKLGGKVDKTDKVEEVLPGVVDNEHGNWEKWNVRTKSTLIILAMFAVLIAIGQIALWGLVILIQTSMFREVVKLGKVVSQERHAPEQGGLQWYFFSVSMLVMNGRMLILNLKSVDEYMQPFIKYHTIGCFILYIGGLVWFVLTLKKGFYKYQFAQFGWAHLTLLLVVYTCHFAIKNMFNGLIWFALPSLLVICNDVFAYICGFFLGRRWIKSPLLELSPKKTWEGFIGATIITFIFGFVVSKAFSLSFMFICPKRNFSFGYETCEIAYEFIPEAYEIPQILQFIFSFFGFSIASVPISPIQIHALFFSLFASLVAPFGGFMASGFKRAFKVKDFGDSIPGHGGFADRFDCQILMTFFISVYFDTFIRPIHSFQSVDALMILFHKLNSTQQLDMLGRIQNALRI